MVSIAAQATPTPTPTPTPDIAFYGVTLTGWSTENQRIITGELDQIAIKLWGAYNSFCSGYSTCPLFANRAALFAEVFGSLTIQYDTGHMINGEKAGPCDSLTSGKIICGELAGNLLGPEPTDLLFHQITHEFGHQFDRAIGGNGRSTLGNSAITLDDGRWVSGLTPTGYVRSVNGYVANKQPYVQHIIDDNSSECYGGSACEDFADMFMNWTWNSFSSPTNGDDQLGYGAVRYSWMDARMGRWVYMAVTR